MSAMAAFSGWLHDGIAKAERLLAVLDNEQRSLAERRHSDLEQLVAEKAGLVRTLEHHASEMGNMLRSAGFAANRTGIDQMLGRAGDERTRGLWLRFESLCAQCRQMNIQNAALVENGRRFAEQALALLRGECAPVPAYGPAGGARPDHDGRLLATV
jgi:flagellar biosynthesis/type III secretory pathway chaperone